MGEESTHINIRIRKEDGEVDVFFTDKNGKKVNQVEKRSVPKEPAVINEKVKYIDRATWWLKNPTGCVWWDKIII